MKKILEAKEKALILSGLQEYRRFEGNEEELMKVLKKFKYIINLDYSNQDGNGKAFDIYDIQKSEIEKYSGGVALYSSIHIYSGYGTYDKIKKSFIASLEDIDKLKRKKDLKISHYVILSGDLYYLSNQLEIKDSSLKEDEMKEITKFLKKYNPIFDDKWNSIYIYHPLMSREDYEDNDHIRISYDDMSLGSINGLYDRTSNPLRDSKNKANGLKEIETIVKKWYDKLESIAKKNHESLKMKNVITIQEDVIINEEILLEKGDVIKILDEAQLLLIE